MTTRSTGATTDRSSRTSPPRTRPRISGTISRKSRSLAARSSSASASEPVTWVSSKGRGRHAGGRSCPLFAARPPSRTALITVTPPPDWVMRADSTPDGRHGPGDLVGVVRRDDLRRVGDAGWEGLREALRRRDRPRGCRGTGRPGRGRGEMEPTPTERTPRSTRVPATTRPGLRATRSPTRWKTVSARSRPPRRRAARAARRPSARRAPASRAGRRARTPPRQRRRRRTRSRDRGSSGTATAAASGARARRSSRWPAPPPPYGAGRGPWRRGGTPRAAARPGSGRSAAARSRFPRRRPAPTGCRRSTRPRRCPAAISWVAATAEKRSATPTTTSGTIQRTGLR